MKSLIVKLPFIGRLALVGDKHGAAGHFPGGVSFRTNLRAKHMRGDKCLKKYNLGSGLVTDAGVAFMADDWVDASQEITNFNFHDSGIGTTAATIGDTTLQTQAGPATRATGTKTNPTAPEVRTVGTIAYTSTLAITEWGLFNQAAQGGTLWDRKVFTAINVVNGDSIQFTYTLTITSGG